MLAAMLMEDDDALLTANTPSVPTVVEHALCCCRLSLQHSQINVTS